MHLLQWFSRAGERASVIAERYIPEAWMVCMVLTLVAFLLFAGLYLMVSMTVSILREQVSA